jgi:sulfur-carrier protein
MNRVSVAAGVPPAVEGGVSPPGIPPDSSSVCMVPAPTTLAMIRVALPYHLRTLARLTDEAHLDVPEPITVRAVLDALEAAYPMLRGTIRDHGTLKRRPFIRFFACKEDLSLDSPDAVLPEAVILGKEPFVVVGAMAGG